MLQDVGVPPCTSLLLPSLDFDIRAFHCVHSRTVWSEVTKIHFSHNACKSFLPVFVLDYGGWILYVFTSHMFRQYEYTKLHKCSACNIFIISWWHSHIFWSHLTFLKRKEITLTQRNHHLILLSFYQIKPTLFVDCVFLYSSNIFKAIS